MGRTSGTWAKSTNGAGAGSSTGPGWGGSARGEAREPIPAAPSSIQENLSTLELLKETDPDEYARRRARMVARRDRARHLEDELYDLAMDPDLHPATRVMAIDKSLDRLKGKAIQPTVKVPLDDVAALTDAELAAELGGLERSGRAQATVIEGDAEEDDTEIVP